MRESDVVFSRSEPLEVVVRLATPPVTGTRVDVAWIELDLDIEGEPERFVSFMVVVDAVHASGPSGEYESVWPEVAREAIVQPGSGRAVRMDATRVVRRWRAV